MPERELLQRLVTRATAGRWSMPVQLGAVLSLLGAVLFILALTGAHPERAWQAFHVN
jgi:hypothetical protein